MACRELIRQLTVANVGSTLTLAYLHSADELMTFAVNFAKVNMYFVKKEEEWKKMVQAFPMILMHFV